MSWLSIRDATGSPSFRRAAPWRDSREAALSEVEWAAVPTGVSWSKRKLQGQLDQTRRQGRKDLVKSRRTDVAVGQSEIRVVEEIEKLSAELKLLALSHTNVLER